MEPGKVRQVRPANNVRSRIKGVCPRGFSIGVHVHKPLQRSAEKNQPHSKICLGFIVFARSDRRFWHLIKPNERRRQQGFYPHLRAIVPLFYVKLGFFSFFSPPFSLFLCRQKLNPAEINRPRQTSAQQAGESLRGYKDVIFKTLFYITHMEDTPLNPQSQHVAE